MGDADSLSTDYITTLPPEIKAPIWARGTMAADQLRKQGSGPRAGSNQFHINHTIIIRRHSSTLSQDDSWLVMIPAEPRDFCNTMQFCTYRTSFDKQGSRGEAQIGRVLGGLLNSLSGLISPTNQHTYTTYIRVYG